MGETVSDVVKFVESLGFKVVPEKKSSNVADGLLGKFKGALPKGKTSAKYVRELRAAGYGKY
jgi:hypothetical protein